MFIDNLLTSILIFLGLPLILGFFIRFAVSNDEIIGSDRLLFGVIAAFWIGMNQSVREIVREKSIFIQEQANHVGCVSYLMSKIFFLGGICLPQAILLSAPLKFIGVNGWRASYSEEQLFAGWGWIIIFFWLGGIIGSCIGLLLSSFCLFLKEKGEATAILLVVLITLPQILYSSKVLPEGLVRDSEHYYKFTVWPEQSEIPDKYKYYFAKSWHQEKAKIPEFISHLTVSRYLSVPLEAISRSKGKCMNPSKAIAFNGIILILIAVVSLTFTWMTLEIFAWWNRKKM